MTPETRVARNGRGPYPRGVLATALALFSAVALGAPGLAPLAGLSLGTFRLPDLALHLGGPRPEGAGTTGVALEGARRSAGSVGGPVCSGDVCQPIVSVPGFEPSYGRAHRSEAFVALLTRAHVEPLATMAWALVSTGLRFDWSPVAMDGPNAGGHGWGSVTLRLRLRLDAHNGIVIPPRPR